jgi:hypothetical protein
MTTINGPDWAKTRMDLVLIEIQRSNGKIKNVIFDDTLVKIMSKISNYIRYDVISRNDNSTFKLPTPTELDLDTFLI